MELALYKVAFPGKFREGQIVESRNWALMHDKTGPGFGIGVSENPLVAYQYLPITRYSEIFEVESLEEKQPIYDHLWRCQKVRIGRKLGFSEIDDFSNDEIIATTDPHSWVTVEKNQIGIALGEGRVLARGGHVSAYHTAKVYAQGRSCVKAWDDATVIAIDRSRVYYYGWVNVILADRAEAVCLN